jgi:ribosomal protein S9
MTALNILTALFIMVSMYGMTKARFQLVIAIAALIVAPTAMGIIDGADGLIYSLAGAAAALLLTAPLSSFKLVSSTDVIISVALGGILGAVQYAIVFGIAMAFLSVQRIFRVDGSIAAAGGMAALSPYGAGLLAFDEKSALVEIEAMKILRKDEKDSAEPIHFEDCVNGRTGVAGTGQVNVFPWCTKLALATLAVLMIGTSI